MRQRLVVVGNGMAPGRALDRLFEEAPDAYDVTIFNAEPRVNYDRIMLSPVLSGEKSFEQIIIHGDRWYVEHGVTLYKGCKVTKIDRDARTVTAAGDIVEPYDKLIIATGSLPIIIPVPGSNLAGVITYRDLDDVEAMLLAAKSRGNAVVIGGGLLGLEAAAGLKERGMDVTVVHLMPTLMERQLDPAAGHLLQKAVEARGIRVITKANTKAILGEQEGRGGAARRRHHDPGRARHHGGRHPRQCRPRQGGRPDRQSRHRGRRRACAPATPTFSRSANAPKPTASATGWSRRSTRWRTWSRRSSRATPMRDSPQRHGHQAQGHRHQALLRRRFRGRQRTARRSCCATPRAASTGGSC